MLIIIIFTTITAFVLFFMGYEYFAHEKQLVSERLQRYMGERRVGIKKAPTVSTIVKIRNFIRIISKYINKTPKVSNIDYRLQQAGIPLKGSEFLVIALGAAVLSGLAVLILTAGSILSAVVVGSFIYVLFIFYIQLKIKKRIQEFNNQLGDALNLLSNALRSGFSFFQAVEMLVKEMKPPISEEFGKVQKEISLGSTTEDALENLLIRVNSEDLELMITAVLIQRQVGGNLAQVLDSISETIRERIMMKREIKALTAQGILSGWVVSLLPVAMGIILTFISPEYLNLLFTEPLGQMFVIGGVISQLIGIVVIRRIVNIQM